MRIRELLIALAAQWDQIRAELGDRADQLTSLVAAFVAEVIPHRLNRRAGQIVAFLTGNLPDGHPLLLILEEPTSRLGTPRGEHPELTAWQPVVGALRARLPGMPPTPTVEEVADKASAWLLAADSLTEAQVRAGGHDPDDPDFIRLDRPDGGVQWPAFQFAEPGGPELVRSINRILRAADDPWGAADWWLGENTWLAGVPARLLGTERAGELIAAALDELAEGEHA